MAARGSSAARARRSWKRGRVSGRPRDGGCGWGGARVGWGPPHPLWTPHTPDDAIDHGGLAGQDELVVVQEAGALGLAHTLGLVVEVGALRAVAALHGSGAGVALSGAVGQREARPAAGPAVVAERLVARAGDGCRGPGRQGPRGWPTGPRPWALTVTPPAARPQSPCHPRPVASRTAVAHAASPAPEQDAPRGAHAGVGPQRGADVREGLLVVAGLVHAPLQADSGVGTCPPAAQSPPGPPTAVLHLPAGPAHLVEGLGVHHGVALLEHRPLVHQRCAVGLCTHLCGDRPGGSPAGLAWVSRLPRALRAGHSLLSWLMEQGSVSRSRAAGQFPARQESTKREAVPSATPMLLVRSSVVSPLKLPQSPERPGREDGWPAPLPGPASPNRALGKRPAPAGGLAARRSWTCRVHVRLRGPFASGQVKPVGLGPPAWPWAGVGGTHLWSGPGSGARL